MSIYFNSLFHTIKIETKEWTTFTQRASRIEIEFRGNYRSWVVIILIMGSYNFRTITDHVVTIINRLLLSEFCSYLNVSSPSLNNLNFLFEIDSPTIYVVRQCCCASLPLISYLLPRLQYREHSMDSYACSGLKGSVGSRRPCRAKR